MARSTRCGAAAGRKSGLAKETLARSSHSEPTLPQATAAVPSAAGPASTRQAVLGVVGAQQQPLSSSAWSAPPTW